MGYLINLFPLRTTANNSAVPSFPAFQMHVFGCWTEPFTRGTWIVADFDSCNSRRKVSLRERICIAFSRTNLHPDHTILILRDRQYTRKLSLIACSWNSFNNLHSLALSPAVFTHESKLCSGPLFKCNQKFSLNTDWGSRLVK